MVLGIAHPDKNRSADNDACCDNAFRSARFGHAHCAYTADPNCDRNTVRDTYAARATSHDHCQDIDSDGRDINPTTSG